MITIGVVSNRLSQRNRRKLDAIDTVAASHPHVHHATLEGVRGLDEALADLARRDVGLLVINGGDGTVQATLSRLIEGRPFARLPLLAVLRSGMTNMIANDVGLGGRPARALGRAVAATSADRIDGRIDHRTTIRLDRGGGAAPIHGMFFGTAGIYRGIQACRTTVHPLGLESSAATAATVAGLVLRRLLPGGREDAVFHGDAMTITVDGGAPRHGAYLLALVTTLERLILRTRPFWGRGTGRLRFTGVAFPPRRFTRSLIPLLYGGEERVLPADDYVSERAESVAFEMTCPFTLDGEFFEPVPGEPVVLAAGERLRFLRC